MADVNKLRRVARASAWVLLAFIIISALSGWGITQTGIIYKASFGLVDRGLANSIHRYMQIPMAATFLVHILVNVKINLPRRFKASAANVILIILGATLLGVVIYMEGL